MKFETGRCAVEYYVERRGDYFPANSMLLKIISDGGAGLQYQANGYAGATPAWAGKIETLADIESIMLRNMSKDEIRTMFRAVLRWNDSPETPSPSSVKLEYLEIMAFAKFSIFLELNGYGPQRTKEAKIKKPTLN